MRPLAAAAHGAWMRTAEPRAGRPGPARRADRRLDAGGVRAHGAARLRAHHRPHDPLARGARRAGRRRTLGARPVLHAGSAPAARGRRTASCGARTASCSPSRASSRSSASAAVIGYLGLGSNVGDRRANLQAAVDALPDARRARCSPPRRSTTPSRSARCSTSPSSSTRACGSRPSSEPEALLDACKAVERELGRAAGGVRHGPRPIDVDVLLLGDVTLLVRAADAPARAGHAPALRARAAARARPRRRAPGDGRPTPRRRRRRRDDAAGPPLRRTTQPVARRPARAPGSPGTSAARARRRAARRRRARTSSIVRSSARPEPICRSAALGALAADDVVVHPPLDPREVLVERAQVGADVQIGGVVDASARRGRPAARSTA